MISLTGTIVLLLVIYFVQRGHPLLAGFLAVIPVKIIGTALMVGESHDSLNEVIGSMLVWQFIWGFVLLGIYTFLK